ncbi:hypothetical protein F370_153 [Campylobacter phage F370]|nr:hypothetical protein F370_153 [Campylobacter phage F370]
MLYNFINNLENLIKRNIMVTYEEIQQLIRNCLDVGIKAPASAYSKLLRHGYCVMYGGDAKFNKLEELEDNFDVKQFDRDTWVIKEYKKELTPEEWKDVNSQALYNGGTPDQIAKDIEDGEKNPIVENAFNKLDEAKLKQISKDDLKNIWNENDLETKREKTLKLISELKYKSPSLEKIIDTIKTTKDKNKIDQIITNIMFVGTGDKVIKI